MPRTPARVNQADIARAVRAVAQAGVRATIEVTREGLIRVVLGEEPRKSVERKQEIII